MLDEKITIPKKGNKRVKNALLVIVVLVMAYNIGILSLQSGYNIGLSESLEFNRNEAPQLHGFITVIKIDGDGNRFISARHNLITLAGRLDICDYIGGTSGAAFDYIAIGTGSGQTESSTTLATEIFRAQGTFAEPVPYNWTITYTWPASTFSGEDVTEFGVFNAAAAGTMLNYQSDGGRVLTAADSLQVIVEFMVTGG